MTPRVPLALSLILSACDGSLVGVSSCDGFESESFDDGADIVVVAADFDAALGDDGALSEEECAALCEAYVAFSGNTREFTACADDGENDDGDELLACEWTETTTCTGRAHCGVERATHGRGRTLAAAWLARAARSEAMSVRSFLGIARELEALGAPDRLGRRAKAAARDEVVHARLLAGLARARGARIDAVKALRPTARPLVAFAVENAVEGCVLETYAALEAGWQARRAPAAVRGAFARIATDEARHAALAWDIQAWTLGRLDAADRRRLLRARGAALHALVASRARTVPSALVRELGLPDAADATRLARALSAAAGRLAG